MESLTDDEQDHERLILSRWKTPRDVAETYPKGLDVALLGNLVRKWFARPWIEKSEPSHGGNALNATHAVAQKKSLNSFPLPDTAAFDRFTDRLQILLSAQKTLPYGQINVIGLDKLRDKLGNRWPKIKDKIHTAANKIIRAQMTAADVFVQYSESEYLIVFGTISPEAGRLKCVKIAEEICAYCLGSPDTADVQVKTAVGRVDDQLLFEEMKGPDVLRDLAAAAQRVETDGIREKSVTASTSPVVAPSPLRVRQPGTAETPPAPPAGETAPKLPPKPAVETHRHRTFPKASFPPPTDHDLWQIVDDLPTFDGAGRGAGAALSFAYRPIWDLKSKLVSTYQCLPVRLFPGYGRRYGYNVLDDPSDPHAIAHLDLETFKEALCMLDELQRNRFQVFISVAIHFETVTTPKFRDVFIEIGRRVPARMRQFVVFDLVHLPDGVPQMRLAEFVTALVPFGSAVLARVALPCKSLAKYDKIGLHAIGIDLRGNKTPEAELIPRINQFVAEAERHKLWTYVRSLRSSSLVLAANTAGVRYVEGDRIGPLVEVPMHIHKYAWEDLWRDAGIGAPQLEPSKNRGAFYKS